MIKDIVIVSQYYAPAWSYGGPPRVLYILASELVKLGINVRIITTDVLDVNRNTILKETLDGVEIFRFKTISNYLAYKWKLIIAPEVIDASKKILQESDFVLFSDVRTIINWQLYSMVYNLNIPYGLFAFGEIPYGYGIKANIKKIMDFLWVNDFIKKATFRFAQTSHECQIYQDYFQIPASNIQILTLPIQFNKNKVDNKLLYYYRKKWGITEIDRIILFVGRLHFLKGIDLLIKGLSPLLKKDPNLKLLIVGRDDGEEKNLKFLVEQQIKKQIIFTGPLYEKDIICAYNLATCFVITPRFYEETSQASLEALSFGIPVIVSQQASIPHLMEYKAGYVIKNEEIIIRKTIMEFLELIKKDELKIKENARKLIADRFSAKIVAKKLLSIIEKN